jgi:hypothetical protein
MIIRLIAVDPHPRKGKSDLLVYQVPEKSREMEFLIELFNEAHVEYALLEAPPRRTDK